MTSEIKIIPTEFNGITYRSRTEARWAHFLTSLGVQFDYEPNGYDLEGEWYLPDFYVHGWDCFIEVKGAYPTECERDKAALLSEVSGKRVLLTVGGP
jgi:hypothetical protein